MDRSAFDAGCAIATRFFSDHVPNGTCRGCGAALGGRRTVWCSTRCSNRWWTVFAREHDWNDARKAALKRDKRRCVMCSREGAPPAEELATLEKAATRAEALLAVLRRKPTAERKRGELTAARRARTDAAAAVKALQRRYQLEVDHLEPRWGGGYKLGCWNHVSNLRTLCHACHVLVTKRQMRARGSPTSQGEDVRKPARNPPPDQAGR